MNHRLRSAWLGLLLTPLLVAGTCEDPDEPPPDCDQRVGADAKGIWAIHAEGRRYDCEDHALNGSLELEVRAFRVDGKPVPTDDNTAGDGATFEADAFVERIRRAQYALEAGSDAPRGLEFSGTVNTCQVSFVLREELEGPSYHEYTFDGFVESAFRMYGEFEGRGPGGCKSEGEFEVELR